MPYWAVEVALVVAATEGSEYPAVIIPMLTQHYAMLQRNLLYTGLTRGKRLVVVVGQKKAIAIAVRNVSGRRRRERLLANGAFVLPSNRPAFNLALTLPA